MLFCKVVEPGGGSWGSYPRPLPASASVSAPQRCKKVKRLHSRLLPPVLPGHDGLYPLQIVTKANPIFSCFLLGFCSQQYVAHTVPKCTRQNKLSEPKFLSLVSPPRGQGHELRGLALLWEADTTFSCGCGGLSSSHSPSIPVLTVQTHGWG